MDLVSRKLGHFSKIWIFTDDLVCLYWLICRFLKGIFIEFGESMTKNY